MRVEKRYGKKIRDLRTDNGLSQEELAERAGIDTRTLQRVEADQTQRGDTLRAIAAAFNLDLSGIREEYLVAEVKPLNSLLITSPHDFRVAIKRAYHKYSYRILETFQPEAQPRVEELMEEIFSDIWAISPDEEPLLSSYIESIRDQLQELDNMGLAFFSIQECRDVFLKGRKIGERLPMEDITTGHFILVPRHGCFHLGGKGSTQPLHQFSAQCECAANSLLNTFQNEIEIGLFVNALHAVVAFGSIEDAIQWCPVCFPLLINGSHISLEYIQKVTGLTEDQIDSI